MNIHTTQILGNEDAWWNCCKKIASCESINIEMEIDNNWRNAGKYIQDKHRISHEIDMQNMIQQNVPQRETRNAHEHIIAQRGRSRTTN